MHSRIRFVRARHPRLGDAGGATAPRALRRDGLLAEAEPGATGLELLLSLALKWADDYAAQQGKDDALSRAVARVTCEAARVAGLAQAGQLGVGSVADVVVFDPAARWTVSGSALSGHVRELLDDGRPVPSFITVYRETRAKITKPKTTK